MSDLISRSEVMNIIESELKLHCGYQADIALFAVKKQVANLPTAYDLNSVLEQLEAIQGKEYITTEDATGKHFVYWEKTCGFDTKTEYAIEIVKNGCKTAKEEKKLPPEVEQRMLKTFLGRN